MVKNPSANAGDARFDPWVGKIPWGRKWQLTPVFLPGESHGQRSLEGYTPWCSKESDMTEHLNTSLSYTLKKKNHRKRDQLCGYQRQGERRWDWKRGLRGTNSSCTINKYQGCNVQHDDYSDAI